MTSRVTIEGKDYLVPDDVAEIFLDVSLERDRYRAAIINVLSNHPVSAPVVEILINVMGKERL